MHDALARPLRELRLSVIEACNFRCPYCMPADRIAEDHGLDAAVIEDLIHKAHQVCPYSNATRGNVDVRLSAK